MGGATHGQVVLGVPGSGLSKPEKQTNKQRSSVASASLLASLGWLTVSCKSNKPSPPPGAFSHCFITATEKQTRTFYGEVMCFFV